MKRPNEPSAVRTLNEKYRERYRDLFRADPPEEVLLLVAFNLDREIPGKRVDGLCVFTAGDCHVYTDGVLTDTFRMECGGRCRMVAEIGSVFAEYLSPDGTPHLILRADNRMRREIGAGMKFVDRAVEFGEKLSPSDAPRVTEEVCPKCQSPYPPGSHVCPACTGKGKTLKRLLGMAGKSRGYIVAAIAFFFLISAVSLLAPYLNRRLIDGYVQAPAGTVQDRVFWIGFATVIATLALVQIFQKLCTMLRGFFLVRAGNGVIMSLREKVFGQIERMSVSRISKRTSGELLNRVKSDTAQIQDFLTGQLPNVLEQVFLFLAVVVILLVTDPRLTLLVLLPAVVVMFSFRLFWRFMSGLFRKSWSLYSRMSTVLHDIFSGIRVVKAFGMEKKESERYDRASRDVSANDYRIERFWAFFNPLLNFLMGAGEFILLYYVGNRILAGSMTIGEMSQFSAYVALIYGPLNQFANLPRQIMRVTTSVNKVFEIVDEQPELTDAEHPKDVKLDGHIDIENVSFGYDEGGEVLRNISLHIKPGEFIGIVGRSGVGKSTLINLIMRMYDPESGRILASGTDLREISQHSLRSQIGVVLQETFLFSGTVYENIAYAKPDATPDEIIAAARLAGAHDFIMKLSDGYDTKIGEHGYTLSGGERQRVAITRALLRDPKILILDEATASLDTETEKQIQEALHRLSESRTTIAIAHRLSTLRGATRLIVLDGGRIAETGTHDELIEKHGIYYGLVMAQREMSRMAKTEAGLPGPATAAAE